MATCIPADENSPIREVKPINGTDFQLAELSTLLSCDVVEIIRLPEKQIMILDEEGTFAKKPRNQRATILADFATPKQMIVEMLKMREAGIPFLWIGSPITDASVEVDYIVGDVIVCHEDELK